MKRSVATVLFGLAMAIGVVTTAAAAGTGESVRRGDTRIDVEKKRGEPQGRDTTYFDHKCRGRQDTYRYAPQLAGDLTQTIYLCDNRVVDIQHSR